MLHGIFHSQGCQGWPTKCKQQGQAWSIGSKISEILQLDRCLLITYTYLLYGTWVVIGVYYIVFTVSYSCRVVKNQIRKKCVNSMFFYFVCVYTFSFCWYLWLKLQKYIE